MSWSSFSLLSLAFVLACLAPIEAHASVELRPPLSVTQEGDTESNDQVLPDGDSATVPKLPAELRIWLEHVGELRSRGDHDGARSHLSALTLSEAYVALLAGADDVALAGLSLIDKAAQSLGLVQVQSDARGERVSRLSASLNADHPDLLRARLKLATMRYALGDFAGARELFELVHEARERLLPADHSDLLTVKLNLAATRHVLGDVAGAHELFESVHEAWERLLPPDNSRLLAAKQNLAVTRKAMGDLAGARELEEQVHEARERLLPPDHPGLLRAKLNLAATRQALGDLEGALELAELVHEAWERLLPADHPDLLAAKLNLAGLRSALGDLAGALELQELVHEARERLLPAAHPDLLMAKLKLAATRSAMGDDEGARELFELVHEMRERVLPPDHPDLLIAKGYLAVTRKALGDLAGARELEELVHEAWERLLPADHPDLLTVKQNLAVTRYALGDLAGASELLELVHEARERLLPADHPDLLTAKLNLAGMRKALGDLGGARELFELVHEARERLLPVDHPELLVTKLNLATTRLALGDLAGAYELFELVHDAWERLLPPDHPDLLATKQNLAVMRYALGDVAGARELEELVHEVRERLLPPDHPDLLATKLNLAGARKDLGDLAGARQLISTILRGQIQRATVLRRDAPRIARAAAETELRRLSACLFLGLSTEFEDARDLGGEFLSALEALRSVSVGAGAIRRAASRRPELAGLLGTLERARGAVSDHRLAVPSGGEAGASVEIDAWRQELFRLAEIRDGLEQGVRRSLAEAGFVSPLPTATRVAAGLPPGGVLIDFLRYRKYDARDPQTKEIYHSIDSLLAFVVTPEGAVTRIELGAIDELELLAVRWRERIGKPIERGVTTALEDESETEIGAKLRARLLDPCLAVLGDATPTELYIILDDFLHPVPMDALPWTDGRRLGEVFDVRVETSAQRLADRAAPFKGEGILLAMGGVDFAARDVVDASMPYLTASPPTGENYETERSSRPGNFAPLLRTRLEVEFLGLMHEELAGGESVVLTRAAASKRALVEHAASVRYLHVATHGWFANETFVSTLDSLEQQNSEVFATFSRADDTVRGFAPETLCGLALAGADHGVNSAGRVPGIITAEELGALDLSGCELAVLSACETNVGLRRAGQGIQSLQMALHAAGVRTAITSLWRVDDAATMRLMELFYTKLWGEQLGKADALWQAKMALREEGFGVKDWAAWVLTGDPR